MEYIIICLAALIASALTFFSGFGLGTILMPVFAIFFPVEITAAFRIESAKEGTKYEADVKTGKKTAEVFLKEDGSILK